MELENKTAVRDRDIHIHTRKKNTFLMNSAVMAIRINDPYNREKHRLGFAIEILQLYLLIKHGECKHL